VNKTQAFAKHIFEKIDRYFELEDTHVRVAWHDEFGYKNDDAPCNKRCAIEIIEKAIREWEGENE